MFNISKFAQLGVLLSLLAAGPFGALDELSATRDFSGTIEVLIEEDLDFGQAETLYFLNADDGQRYRVQFVAPSNDLSSGSSVTFRGTLSADGIRVDRGDQVTVTGQALRAPSDRSSIVLRVDFQDNSVGCTESTIASIMYDGTFSVDGLYQDTSFGAVSFPRDTDGDGQADIFDVTIGANIADSCNPDGWAAQADTEATNSGINLSQYTHKIYVLPQTSCTWAGRANVGCGSSCRTWIDVCSLPDVYAHELGHNLSLRHSSSDTDNDGSSNNSYGDVSDFMGYGGYGWRQVNGPHKVEMGWIPANQIIDGDQPGTVNYVLSPLETDPSSAPYPQVIRISRPPHGDDLYLSYRRQIGYDVGLRTEYVDKTSVHSHNGPGSATLYIQALDDGQQFNDATIGLDVLQVSHDDLSVTLQVTLPGSGCPDADSDGVCDADDVCPGGDDGIDSDLDGIPDFCDTCPSGDNASDNDVDGVCDAEDFDDDNDGVDDTADCAPMMRGVASMPGSVGPSLRIDKTAGVTLSWNAGSQGHTSNVYRGSVSHPWVDNESCIVTESLTRSVVDTDLPAPGSAFYYLIGARNICGESFVGGSNREPLAACAIGTLETDGDSVPDLADTCPMIDDASLVDGDGDFIGDVCDNCLVLVNPSQANLDGDALGDDCDSCTDRDQDGFGDPGMPNNTCQEDNCPFQANPSQTDSDGDGPGDACDVCPNDPLDDADTDAFCGNVDNCPLVTNPNQTDTDGDSRGDACDACPDDPAKIDPGNCGCGVSEAACVCDWAATTEHILNGDFDLWTQTDPDSWGIDETGGPISQEQVPPRVMGGSGSSARMDRNAEGVIRLSKSGLQFIPGKWYRLQWHGLATDPAGTDVVWKLSNNTAGQTVANGGTIWWAPTLLSWTPSDTWGAHTKWIQIDPSFDGNDWYAFVLRWEAGTIGETVYVDQVTMEGPFDALCVN